MISIEKLHLEFPGRLILEIDNLLIKQGIILGLIGPNGAGKSTLLNVLSLFQKPERGSVEVFGKNILDLKNPVAYRRRMSYVFSRPYLLDDTVYNNIRLPLKLRRINKVSEIDEMLDLFKIRHLANEKALKLSQGETHRVSLARAFVTQPEFLLLDEPFSSLDPHHKNNLLMDLRRIIKEKKITTLFVTQDHNEALFLSDVIGVMKNGKILQTGIPQDVFMRPASKEVADFVGVETVVDGEVIKKENSLCNVLADKDIIKVVSECETGDKVLVCIRPENVTISAQNEKDSARNHFRATIKNLVSWGLEYKIDLDCGFNLVAFVTKQSVNHLELKKGQHVYAAFKATAAHLIKRG